LRRCANGATSFLSNTGFRKVLLRRSQFEHSIELHTSVAAFDNAFFTTYILLASEAEYFTL
jgi:hypothetical protein